MALKSSSVGLSRELEWQRHLADDDEARGTRFACHQLFPFLRELLVLSVS